MKVFLALMALVASASAATTANGDKRQYRVPSAASMERARQVLDTYPVIDGHNDFPMGLRDLLQNDMTGFNFNSDLSAIEPWASYVYDHTDIPRMRAGGQGGQFWSAYINCNSAHKDAVQLFLEQVDVIKRLVADNQDNMRFATTAQEVEDAMAAGYIASMIGVESGHAINSNLAILRTLYQQGVRYMTLTHGCNTPWADAAQVEYESGGLPVRNDGLSEFGRTVIQEMNRLGMFVDLSHVSSNVMRDALAITQAPVIFSHSSARALCSHPRNIPDDVLLSLAVNGGVAMVNFYPYFLEENGESTLDDAVAHINHIREIAGVQSVGIGSDFCGIDEVTPGLEDSSTYPNLFAALIESEVAWTDEELGLLAQGNLLRAMRQMEAVRDALQGSPINQAWLPKEEFETGETECMSESFWDL